MAEKKALNEEELNKVTGGDGRFDLVCGTRGYNTPGEVQFQYAIGKEEEICDYDGLGGKGTHRACCIKLGAFIYDGRYFPCYYYQGIPYPEEHVDGWYPENKVDHLHEANYADDSFYHGCDGCTIITLYQ